MSERPPWEAAPYLIGEDGRSVDIAASGGADLPVRFLNSSFDLGRLLIAGSDDFVLSQTRETHSAVVLGIEVSVLESGTRNGEILLRGATPGNKIVDVNVPFTVVATK